MYLDTCVLAKLFVAEPDSEACVALVSGSVIVSSELALGEFFSTLLRKEQANAYYGMAEAFEALGDYRNAVEAMQAFLHRAKPNDPFRRKGEAAIWEWRQIVQKQMASQDNPPK